MIVVSDTSPLSYLHQIELVEALSELFGDVVVPPAVEAELRAAPTLHADLDWSKLRIVAPSDRARVTALEADLDLGESEAIVVALELRADLLLIDEATGREVAAKLGLRRTGLLGVLLEAKRRGLLAAVRPALDRLQEETTFRLHSEVRAEVLRLAGEPD